MKKLISFRKIYSLIIILAIAVIVNACQSGAPKNKKEKNKDLSVSVANEDIEIVEDLKRTKQIFYSLPSPLETAMILKRAGADYHPDILNSVDRSSRYNTNKSMALNLGIYTTDMSYCSLFDQTQETIKYMSATKRMAEGLGILNAIDDATIQQLEENINNRDVILDIISETFLNSSSFLKEDERESIATIILVGGWLEGLYIACVINEKAENQELKQTILDQGFSVGNIIKLLENNSTSSTAYLLKDVNGLKQIFDRMKVAQKEVSRGNKAEAKLKDRIYQDLVKKVKELRNNYIS